MAAPDLPLILLARGVASDYVLQLSAPCQQLLDVVIGHGAAGDEFGVYQVDPALSLGQCQMVRPPCSPRLIELAA